MMFLLLNLLQQQGRLSKVVIIGAVLVFIAGVSLLVYFYRRYKRIEKDQEEDWDASRHSLFVNVSPPAPTSEVGGAVIADIGALPTEAVTNRGTREFASEIELISPTPASSAEALAEPVPPPPEEPVTPVLSAEPPREHRPTEVLASPSTTEAVTKTDAAQKAPAFDDELWAGLEMGEQPTMAHEGQAETRPLQSTAEPPRVARVDERPHREPFEPPSIERITHREPYETPRIEPLTPREQAGATRALRSTPPPPQIEEPSRERPMERSARDTGLFGATPFRPSSPPSTDARSREPHRAEGETRELAAQPAAASAGRLPEPAVAGSYARRAPAGSVLGLPAEASRQPLILGEPVRAASETGIGALSNYGKDLSEKSGRAGTIALLIVVVLLGGAVGLYLLVPSIHARVNAFVAHVRGTDTQAAMKPRAQIIPSYRPEVNKNMVTARGAVDNISDEPLENLFVEVQLQRGADAPLETRTVSVTPNPLPPGQRGMFEFEYDGKRDTGFTGYKITRLLSNETEVKFRTPQK